MAASLVAASHIAARGERKGARDCTLKGRSLHDFGERGNVTRYLGYQDTLFINVWPGGGPSTGCQAATVRRGLGTYCGPHWRHSETPAMDIPQTIDQTQQPYNL